MHIFYYGCNYKCDVDAEYSLVNIGCKAVYVQASNTDLYQTKCKTATKSLPPSLSPSLLSIPLRVWVSLSFSLSHSVPAYMESAKQDRTLFAKLQRKLYTDWSSPRKFSLHTRTTNLTFVAENGLRMEDIPLLCGWVDQKMTSNYYSTSIWDGLLFLKRINRYPVYYMRIYRYPGTQNDLYYELHCAPTNCSGWWF